MSRVVIWSGGKADIIREALGPAFSRLDTVPDNVTVPFEEGQLLEAEQGDVVLAMGTKCLKLLGEHKLCHKNRALKSLRQTPIAGPKGGIYLLTLDPFLVRTQADAPSLIRQDVALACRLALTGKVEPQLGDYQLVEDLGDLIVEIDRRLGEDPELYVELACDTETLGLHPEGQFDFTDTPFSFLKASLKDCPPPRIITIQFTLDEGSGAVLQVPQSGKLDQFNQDCVEWLLTNPRVLLSGANWKYDSRWIYRHLGVLCDNLSKDVLLMASAVDENRSNSLKTLAWEYSDKGGYDQLEAQGYDKGRMDLIPIEEIVPYAGCDTDVTAICARKLKTEMMRESPALVRLYRKVLLPASSAFEAMEHEGVYVDLDEFAKLRHELTTEIDLQQSAMLDLMPQRLKLKYADKIKDQLGNGKSPLVPSLLRDYFFSPYGLNLKPKMVTEKSEEPSTAKAHLMMFHDVPEAMAFLAALEANNSATKTRSTFVDGFLKHLRADGRLHPSYMLFVGAMYDDDDEDSGAVTGRTSCKEPAFQCLDGASLISSNYGKVVIQDIVGRYEAGERFKVQTHTGAWRDVVGVYRNGVRPVFRVRTRLGREINCTSNHPLLTDRGFVVAGRLHIGDAVFVTKEWDVGESERFYRDAVWASGGSLPRCFPVTETALDLQMRLRCAEVTDSRTSGEWDESVMRMLAARQAGKAWPLAQGEGDTAVLGVAAREVSLLQHERPGVRELRREGHRDGLRVARQFRDIRSRHGRTSERTFAGPQKRERALLEEQLSVGYGLGAATESPRHAAGDLAGPDALRLGVGSRYWHGYDSGSKAEPWVDNREGLHNARQAAQAGYVLDEIVSIEYVGERETFDLTIDRCHSFIGDGIVVHNTIPKKTKWAKKLRACYPAPPGFVMSAFDFSQGELKVVACVAEEENMLASFQQGLDLHCVTAAAFMDISYDAFLATETADPFMYTLMRTGAKAGNFGLLYGMQVNGFREYARINYGVTMSAEETQDRRDKFFQMYPGLLAYHENMKQFARRHGYVESPLGSRRHLPLIKSPDNESRSSAERQAINAPIQSTLNHLAFMALAEIRPQLPQQRWFGMVHDQILAYTPEDLADTLPRQTKEIMDNLPIRQKLGWDHQLQFTTDGEVGPRMSEMKKIKG